MTRESLDAAECTGKPLLVMARNRVFLYILHPFMAFSRLFMAFLEAQLGIIPLRLQVRYRKFCSATGVGCGWRRTTHRTGRRPTTCSCPGSKLHPYLHMWRRTVREKRLWGCEHCYALCTRLFRRCHALRADPLLLRSGNTDVGNRGRTICYSSKRIVIQCLRVRLHAVWD